MGSESLSPPYTELVIRWGEKPILRIPSLLLSTLIQLKYGCAWFDSPDHNFLHMLFFPFSSGYSNGVLEHKEEYFPCLKDNVAWAELANYIDDSSYVFEVVRQLWMQRDCHCIETTINGISSSFSMDWELVKPREKLYRYMRFDWRHLERIEEVFIGNTLYFSSPFRFNDPFDCGVEDNLRSACNKSAMLCLSELKDNVLMYSHYADEHRGFCLVFDTEKLAKSISSSNDDVSNASIRRVHYFKKIPDLKFLDENDFQNNIVFGCTTKASSWAYEKEWRVFLEGRIEGQNPLLHEGKYKFNPDALTGVIFGCRASRWSKLIIKEMTAGRKNFSYEEAKQLPSEFDLKIEKIPSL